MAENDGGCDTKLVKDFGDHVRLSAGIGHHARTSRRVPVSGAVYGDQPVAASKRLAEGGERLAQVSAGAVDQDKRRRVWQPGVQEMHWHPLNAHDRAKRRPLPIDQRNRHAGKRPKGKRQGCRKEDEGQLETASAGPRSDRLAGGLLFQSIERLAHLVELRVDGKRTLENLDRFFLAIE